MNPEQRIVTQLPLTELWTSHGPLTATRLRVLAASDLAVFLRERSILKGTRFVVADVGYPLRWLDSVQFLAFWESDARGRLVDPVVKYFQLEDFPGAICFTVHEWRSGQSDAPILVFERHH